MVREALVTDISGTAATADHLGHSGLIVPTITPPVLLVTTKLPAELKTSGASGPTTNLIMPA
jgi:hypothetical protein